MSYNFHSMIQTSNFRNLFEGLSKKKELSAYLKFNCKKPNQDVLSMHLKITLFQLCLLQTFLLDLFNVLKDFLF
jgi:hypothetical protein